MSNLLNIFVLTGIILALFIYTLFLRRAAAEKERDEANKNLQKILEMLPVGVRIMSLDDYTLLYSNKACLEVFNCTSFEEISGKSGFNFMPEYQPDGKKTADLMQEILENDSAIVEIQCLKAGGEPFLCLVTSSNIKYLGHNASLAVMEDITEKKRLQKELEQSLENEKTSKRVIQNYSENLEQMVKEKTETIVKLKNAVMETIAELVERRDDATGGHISRTSSYLKLAINEMLHMGIYSNETVSWNVEQMIISAQLHDVGKIAIDDVILRKPGKLTEIEFEQMKTHAVYGGEIIKEIQKKTDESAFLNYAYIFAVYHHEKWDGTGYPYGLSKEEIPLPARLMALIDVYDALISERPYKKAFSHKEAVKIIAEGKGTHFDPVLTDLFLSISDQLYIIT